MGVKKLKYIFIFLSVLLLGLMLLMSRDAGVNCDEVLHYDHSVDVCNYFATGGKDRSALDTPVTSLKYYGQSYDNITTFIIRFARIDDIYGFRHFMSSIAGWLTILVTALFAVWLSGYEAGISVLILFALSPTFLGHSQNNLKDIPFALSYISGVYFFSRLIDAGKTNSPLNIIMLTLSIAFAISIRSGGLILVFYIFLFAAIWYSVRFFKEGRSILQECIVKFLLLSVISAVAFFLGILLWPYALQDPVRNTIESYRVMLHFPDTFRQLFEGKAEWSDFMPWYYLPKSMLITIPLIVTLGLAYFTIFSGTLLRGERRTWISIVIFTVFFPVALVIISRSNLYSSWRHFLFVYPGIVLLSALGIHQLVKQTRKKQILAGNVFIMIALSLHPLYFTAANHRYAYLYYNQFAGGTKGASGNYETDYYYVSQREASEWLISYLERNRPDDSLFVASNFSVEWFFRKMPQVRNIYTRYEERSNRDWDYAILTQRYIPVSHNKGGIWPPRDALYVIYAGGAPVSAVIERKTKASYYGCRLLDSGRPDEAIRFFDEAVKADSTDEMIFYNFAVALYTSGRRSDGVQMLKRSLSLNPVFEPALMYLGNIAEAEGRKDEAIYYYRQLLAANRKYYEAYVKIAELISERDFGEARKLLRQCLSIYPGYRPAIIALGDTYRDIDPETARKYYDQAEKVK